MKISDRIAEIRKSKGMTQEQFAKLIGIGQETISQYERGVRNPSFRAVKGLRSAGIDMNWLLDSID